MSGKQFRTWLRPYCARRKGESRMLLPLDPGGLPCAVGPRLASMVAARLDLQ